MFYAYPIAHTGDGQIKAHVQRVTILHDEGQTKIARYEDSGYVGTVAGPYSDGKLFETEAEGWQYCAEFFRREAAKIDAAAAECAAKAGVVEVAS
jgi:hypothetical protein